MKNDLVIKLYGSKECHKSLHYVGVLNETDLNFEFLDVVANKIYEKELRSLYENGKANFPTITIGTKKLRNPSDTELNKWLNKLTPINVKNCK